MHADHKYVEALRQNNQIVIREIYSRFSGEALRWVLNNSGSAADARDIFQEAVLVMFEKSRQPDFVLTCPLGALLYLFYSRKWIDRLREKKREIVVRNSEENRYASETVENLEILAEESLREANDQKRLSKTFAHLSELCRNLLSLLAEGISPRDAAEKLQFNSVDTLYRRKNACVQRWKTLYLNYKL